MKEAIYNKLFKHLGISIKFWELVISDSQRYRGFLICVV